MDEKPPENPHDRFFRGYLGLPRHAEQLLRWQLPAALQSQLDWSTLEVRSSTYVDEKLRLRESDLLIELRTISDEPFLVFFLWEHQSRVEPFMAWRMLEYRTEVLKRWIADNPKTNYLPYLHAVVLYQGKGAWTAPLAVAELQPSLGEQSLRSAYDVLPVVALPELGWPDDISLRAGLGLMRAVTLKRQCEWLIEEEESVAQLLKESGGESILTMLIRYILVTDEDADKVIQTYSKLVIQ